MKHKVFIIIFVLIIVLSLTLLTAVFVLTLKDNASDDNESFDPTRPITPTCSEPENWIEPNVTYDKPIIYLYPTQETQINIQLGSEDTLTTTYPLYDGAWEVIAQPNGDLKDVKTGRNLYALYYECNQNATVQYTMSGFVVSRDDICSFLEEKLAILGLSEHEAEEFIIYWLPRLQKSEYNYIRFANMDEINKIMPLNITPSPDTTIRVLMYFKGLDSPMKVKEQELECVERTGFTVVEWGGCELSAIRRYFPKMPCGGQPIRIRMPFKLGKN